MADWHLPPTEDPGERGGGLLPSAALSGLFSAMLPLEYIYPLWDHLLGCGLGISEESDGTGEGRLLQPFLLLALLLREHSKLVLLDGDVLTQGLKGCLALFPLTCSSPPIDVVMEEEELNEEDDDEKKASAALVKSTQAKVEELSTALKKEQEEEQEEGESLEDMNKKLEDMEVAKKQAAKEKNFKQAGSIAKEIKALKDKIASQGDKTEEEKKVLKEAKIAELTKSLEDARLIAEKALQQDTVLNGVASDKETLVSSCHVNRLKQFQSAQQWLVYAGLGCYLPGFASKEIDNLSDLLDVELCSDEELMEAPISMSSMDIKHFRTLVDACNNTTDSDKSMNSFDEKFMNYQAKGPTTNQFTHHDIVVMQWCLEAYELFRRTPTSFIIHALKDAESRHLAIDTDMESSDDVRSSSPGFADLEAEENGGSCLGRFCMEVSVGEVVPQLCKASALNHEGSSSSSASSGSGRGGTGSVLTTDSKSLIERALDMASLQVLTKDKCGTLQYVGRENSPLHKPRFLCLDCRPAHHVTRWGKFATTFTLDTPLDTISHVKPLEDL